MSWVRQIFSRGRMYGELTEEIGAHLEEKVEELVASGMARKDAEAAARREFGNVALAEEEGRDVWRWTAVESLVADFRYGMRMLGKTPGFTVIAVTILAVGIGANAAVFSLIDALLLRSLVVPAPEQLVRVSFGPPGDAALTGPIFDRLRERQSAFSDVFAWTNAPMVLTENGAARPIQAAYATGSAFPTLELKPRLGRLLDWHDDELNGQNGGFAAVVSEAFWKEHFHGSAEALGQRIVVNGVAATIVGVMPESFHGITVDYDPQVVLPFTFDVAVNKGTSNRFDAHSTCCFAMARLKPGITYAQAEANLAVIASDVLKEALPPDYRNVSHLREGRLSISPGRRGQSPLGKAYATRLWTLQGLVGLLMVICCMNLASLQLSRSLSRQHELVVRSSLGAGRWRLVRQLVAESTLLSGLGAVAGILLSEWMSSLLVRYVEQSDFPVFLDLRPNLAVFALAIGLAALTVILAGVLPAFSLTRLNAEEMLRSGRKQALAGPKHRLAASLLPLQVALSFLLASLALLFAVSAGKLLRMDPGFRVKGVTLFSVDFSRRPEKKEEPELYQRMLDALRQAPGVEATSVLAVPPFGEGGMDESAVPVEGNGPEDRHLFMNIVGPDYFATAGTRVTTGREFSERDRLGATRVCVLNQAAGNLFFPGQSAVGKHIRATGSKSPDAVCEVVGMVADAKYLSLKEPAPPTIYYPYKQREFGWEGFITRSQETSLAVAAFRDALRRVAPDTPLMPAITMQRQLEDSIGQERLMAALSLFFGAVALALIAIGLYGLESQRVTQRTAEIGLRMALGAQRGQVLWSVAREVAVFFVVGLPIGLGFAVAAARFAANLLYETSPLDPRVHAAAIAAILIAGSLATYLPARRAMRVDPITALRYE